MLNFYPQLFPPNLMGRFSTLIYTPKPGPSEGTSSTQGEQPRAVTTQPVVTPRPFVATRPLAIVHPPPAIASSPTTAI